MENSVQKLIEEIAQIAEKYDVTSRCVLDIRRLKERYQDTADFKNMIIKLDLTVPEKHELIVINKQEGMSYVGGKSPYTVMWHNET